MRYRHYHVGSNVAGLMPSDPVATAERYDEARGLWLASVVTATELAFREGALDRPDRDKLDKMANEYSGDVIEYINGRSISVVGKIHWFAVCKIPSPECPMVPGVGITEDNLRRDPAPEGHYYTESGTLAYDVTEHIRRAFKNAPRKKPGGEVFLTAAEIATYGVTSWPEAPGPLDSDRRNPGAIAARLKGLMEGRGSVIKGCLAGSEPALSEIRPAYKFPGENRIIGAWG